ncbi:MAG: hypothetical protein KKD05_00255 [Candidatus Omnitrophica bacterium]|nr:hypothetical protein [Candidatus Omnitrophota bacterium]
MQGNINVIIGLAWEEKTIDCDISNPEFKGEIGPFTVTLGKGEYYEITRICNAGRS